MRKAKYKLAGEGDERYPSKKVRKER